MSVSKKAKAEDMAHMRRLKKLTPKARFKDVSKLDQYIITARTLSHQLAELRKSIGGWQGKIASGYQITVRTIDRRYVETDPATGFLTRSSVQKIKRAVSNAFKKSIGSDTQFMFVIEQQDKGGSACAPHIHALSNIPFKPGTIPELKKRLHKVAGESDKETVKLDPLSVYSKHHSEYAPGEGHYRRTASYGSKNDNSHHFRSKSLLVHVHAHFEELKKRYGILP